MIPVAARTDPNDISHKRNPVLRHPDKLISPTKNDAHVEVPAKLQRRLLSWASRQNPLSLDGLYRSGRYIGTSA
jgi:hypothetical protein